MQRFGEYLEWGLEGESFAGARIEVSRSGYHRWAGAKPSMRAQEDEKLAMEVRQIHDENKGRYGSPRIHRELRARGQHVGRKRVVRLMGQQGLRGHTPRRFRKTTNSRHHHRIAPNLLARNFTAQAPNQAWVGDISVPTRDGWLYLAGLLDLFSRRAVGWAMSDHIDTELALNALQMAVDQRQPEQGLIHHSDRDCRHASADHQAQLSHKGMIPSMSGEADCWDNGVAESFFATLEKELLATEPLKTRPETRTEIAEYIENYYKNARRHSYLDYLSPLEFELVAA